MTPPSKYYFNSPPLLAKYVMSCVSNITIDIPAIARLSDMHLKRDSNSAPIEISKVFSFEITAFPTVKPKFNSLKRSYDGHGFALSENNQGEYQLENISTHVEAKVTLSPNLYEDQSKDCEITFSCNDIAYRYNEREKVVEFAEDISSRTRWKHKIVWFTDDGSIVEWKNE
jgi:hypothetical protein